MYRITNWKNNKLKQTKDNEREKYNRFTKRAVQSCFKDLNHAVSSVMNMEISIGFQRADDLWRTQFSVSHVWSSKLRT